MNVDFDPSVMKPSMASALEAVFEPLRVCLETVEQKVDVARGFDALDAACAGAGYGCALELFGLRWGIFRGTAQPPEVDPFAAAIVAQDLPRLKELIEFMTKISETRGYSALLKQIDGIESLVADPSLEDEVFTAIILGCRNSLTDTAKCHDFVVKEVRDYIESDTFRVRAAVAALLPVAVALVDAIADSLVVRNPATRGQAGYLALAELRNPEKHDNHAPLRKAVGEAAGVGFGADAVVAAAEVLMNVDFDPSAVKSSMASALEALFELLRVCLETVKQKVDIARGFDALDAACAGAPGASALKLFAL
jgi:hypothetical protein